MPTTLSFASWNVEHFSNDNKRVADCAAILHDLSPDDSAKRAWIDRYSDHGILYGQIAV